MEESISNSMLSRESNRLTNLIRSADPPLLYGFGSSSFSFPFFSFLISCPVPGSGSLGSTCFIRLCL